MNLLDISKHLRHLIESNPLISGSLLPLAEDLERKHNNQRYYLVIGAEYNYEVKVHDFVSKNDLITGLQTVLKESEDAAGLRAYMFHGEQVYLSKGPVKHILEPDSQPVPLIPVSDKTLEPDKEGRLVEV